MRLALLLMLQQYKIMLTIDLDKYFIRFSGIITALCKICSHNYCQRYLSLSSMKQLQPKDFKKKKSQDSFFNRVKITSHQKDQLKYMCPRKSQTKLTNSLLDLYPSSKEHKKRVNSLQIAPNDLSLAQQTKPSKTNSTAKIKNSIGQCYSDRNMSLINDPNKLFKYRKFSSNADLPQEEIYSSLPLKEKMVQMEEQKVKAQKAQAKNTQKYPLTSWLVVIRKIYAKEYKKIGAPSLLLSLLIQNLGKQQRQEFSIIKQLIQPIANFQAQLTKEHILTIISKHFQSQNDKSKIENKKKDKVRVSYTQIVDCLAKYLVKCSKSVPAAQNKTSSSEEHEEVVQTARFQENNVNQQLKKHKKAIQASPFLQMTGKTSESQSIKTSNLGSQQRKSSLTSKNKPNILACLSPFNMNEAKSNNQSNSSLPQLDSQSIIFKKGSFHCQSKEQLGMLTLQGKSPRQLMQSQIFQSIQKLGVSCPRSNMSFSLQNLEIEPHLPFEQSVRSFQQFLKKIKNIQTSYRQKLNSSNYSKELVEEQQPSEQVNTFLQQLISYRIAVNHSEMVQNYSYLVSFQDVLQFKEQNIKIMSVLLQTVYVRQYFLALQGVKFQNSKFLYQKVEPLLHQDLRILNLNNNNLNNINSLISNMPQLNSLQFININFNQFTDVCPIISKFAKLRELHAKNNNIQKISCTFSKASQLKIIQLGYNQIFSQNDLVSLKTFTQLEIINLIGNPCVKAKDWRLSWKQIVNIKIIYEMQTLYVMSSFGHQKDIAFSSKLQAQKKGQKRKQLAYSKPKQIDPQLQEILKFNEQKTNKQNQRDPEWMSEDFSLIREEKALPKQRISKIKTFLDGKVI